ncbi:MAG TPA: hypothetical protein VEB21_00470 [Terriglobales bacterium]|nr:hypothetical protein [Terriglobales bacterium]
MAELIWVTHMKTTIEIATPLLKRAKHLAARRGTTLRVIVEEALRDALQKEESPAATDVTTHTFAGRGLQPGLSWDDWATIRDLAYRGRGG